MNESWKTDEMDARRPCGVEGCETLTRGAIEVWKTVNWAVHLPRCQEHLDVGPQPHEMEP